MNKYYLLLNLIVVYTTFNDIYRVYLLIPQNLNKSLTKEYAAVSSNGEFVSYFPYQENNSWNCWLSQGIFFSSYENPIIISGIFHSESSLV